MKNINTLQVISFVFFSCSVFAQDLSRKALQEMADDELLSLSARVARDSVKAERIIRVYLERVKKEKDTIKIARGYDRLARIFNPKKNLQFADSVIYFTSNKNHISYPALGYILKGNIYNKNQLYKKALDNFLIAYQYSLNSGSLYHQLYIKKSIIRIKSRWGNSEEALKLSKEYYVIIDTLNFEKMFSQLYGKGNKISAIEKTKMFRREHLQAIDLLIFSNFYAKRYDSAFAYVKKGIEKSLAFNETVRYHEFLSRSGELLFNLQEYDSAIDSLQKGLPFRNNPNTILNDYYHLGFSYLYLGNRVSGIEYLLKADSIFNITKKILPSHSKMFEELYWFYEKNNDKEKQKEYFYKLIYTDSITKENNKYIDSKIVSNYETPLLLKEKEALISSLNQKNKRSIIINWWTMGLFGTSLLGLLYYFKKQQDFKKRFKNLMIQQDSQKKENQDFLKSNNKIPEDIMINILNHLDTFEMNKQYLSKGISIQDVAKSFGTNYNYLSKVINLKKEQNFPNYINNLRLEYIFNELKINSKYREYTIKAIAQESGFISAGSFSKAFYKKYEIYPSFYIKQLKKAHEIN